MAGARFPADGEGEESALYGSQYVKAVHGFRRVQMGFPSLQMGLGVWFKSAPLGAEKCDLEQ